MKNSVVVSGAVAAALGAITPASASEVDQSQADERDTIVIPTKRVEILVAASRDEQLQVEDYTGSALVISSQEIEARQVRDIAEVLRDVPGVAVAGVAGQTQIRVRGSEANHTLVLVDGIEVSDPFSGEFDFGTLQAELGSSVTVLRGPQSALYGSDAIGGLIAYDTGEFEGFAMRAEIGTNSTFNAATRAGVSEGGFSASLSGTLVSTDGEPNARGGNRDIGRESFTLSGKTAFELDDKLEFRAVGRFVSTQGDFNDADFVSSNPTFGFVIDSPEVRFENEAAYGLVGFRLEAAEGLWIHDISAQLADVARDTSGPFGRTSGSDGDRVKVSYVTAYDTRVGHSVSFAADWEREQFRNDDPFGFASSARQRIENTGLVAQYRYNRRALDLSAALRHDINDRFADATTFRVGAAYRIADDTRIRASAGSGIKNPGFFELFGFVDGRFIGNDQLQPEKSTGWEVGLDKLVLNGSTRFSATYFNSTLEREIFTTFPPPDFLATPANRESDSTQQGIEVSVSTKLGAGFTFDGAYSFLDAEENGLEEVRRPDHIASAVLDWQAPGGAFSANLAIRHNGEADDFAFTDPSFVPVRVTLDDYTLVNLNGRLRLSEGIEAFARVENLLDEAYEQVFSFVSPGRSATIGLRAEF